MCHDAHLSSSLLNLSCNNCLISDLPHPEDTALDILPTLYESHAHEINKHSLTTSHFDLCLDGFADVIKQTFKVTTQVCLSTYEPQKVVQVPFPTLNVHKRDGPVATNTIHNGY